jgi:hypothetical protein
MAYFRLREDAQSWFSEISGGPPFRTKFDIYYLCLMAGFASGRATELVGSGAAATDFVEKFVEDYRPSSRLLIGLLVTAELRKSGIDVSEKAQVRSLFKRLVDSESPNSLTDQGMRRLNAYASGGYEYIAEKRDMKPYAAEEFIQGYTALIAEAIESASAGVPKTDTGQ